MIEYELKFDKKFLKKWNKLDNSIRLKIDKKILALEKNPKKGNPLFNIYPHLYELYAESYRIYYVVQDGEVRVIVMAFEHKDIQEKYLNLLKKDKTIIDNILKEIV